MLTKPLGKRNPKTLPKRVSISPSNVGIPMEVPYNSRKYS